MTVTETESKELSIPIGDWDDRTLVEFTAALVNDIQARMKVGGSDTKTLGAFNAAMRDAFRARGRITLELVPEPRAWDVTSGTEIDARSVPAEITAKRTFGGFDLETLQHGQVLTLRIPTYVFLQRQIDSSKVELPAGWAGELGSALGSALTDGLKSLPAPVVENNITLDNDLPPQEITFKHDPHTGWTTSAHVEDAS